jgi:hypothetical protein
MVGGAVQPAKEALDAAVRMRQNARMSLVQHQPLHLDSANRSSKIQVLAEDSPSGGAALEVSGASNYHPSMLKIPGFMSAKIEAKFAAAASLGRDQPVSSAHPSNRTSTRRRLVEPVDSRNPRVGRGMAKIYSGEMHAIR